MTEIPAARVLTAISQEPAVAVGPASVAGVWLGRVAAVLAVGSAVVHLRLAAAGEIEALAMAVMALVCLSCAWHLWRAPTQRIWTITAMMDGGMLALHAPMLLQHRADMASMNAGTGLSVHAASGDMTHIVTSPLMVLGFLFVAAQLLVAAGALLRPRGAATGGDKERAPFVSDDVSPRPQSREPTTYRTGDLS